MVGTIGGIRRSATGHVRESYSKWEVTVLAAGGGSPITKDEKMTEELRRFITVDSRKAVKIGDLEKESVVLLSGRQSMETAGLFTRALKARSGKDCATVLWTCTRW